MAVPSIASITPSAGPSAGGFLVEIAGSGFQLPGGGQSRLASSALASVRVLLGGRPARDVRVYTAGRLSCVVPSGSPGAIELVVQNLDTDGLPIPGEMARQPDGFTYVAQSLTAEADLTRLVRALLRELKTQVLSNVVLTVQTD